MGRQGVAEISGICRGTILVASPRLASSNAKNLLLGIKLVLGGREGRAIWAAHFDATYYKWANPDVARTGIPPWLHYLLCGYFEDRNPSGSFDSAYYRSRHLDVRNEGINPLLHYAMFGRHEERSRRHPWCRYPNAAQAPLQATPRRWSFSTDTAPRAEGTACPLVSVVIPCFNYGQYLEQAIHSVLSQTFTNLEIIVVEGGSTDGTTPGILRALEQSGLPRTRFVYRTESHLVGDNRNFGYRACPGPIVCCLDADDLIKPTYSRSRYSWPNSAATIWSILRLLALRGRTFAGFFATPPGRKLPTVIRRPQLRCSGRLPGSKLAASETGVRAIGMSRRTGSFGFV